MTPDSPIEAYLDRLLLELRSQPPRHVRQLLAETEAHLRDTADAAVAGGMSRADAEADAVERFGPAPVIAQAERERSRTPLATIARQCLASGWFLGAVGALAVGVSGLVAALLGAIGGSRFLADNPGRLLSASDCARWLGADPGALSCHQAAVADWAAETVYYRLAAGLFGAVALAVFIVARRRLGRLGHWTVLPAAVVDTIALTLFGAAGAVLLAMGVSTVVVSSGHGAGQWLSAAPVALAAAAVFGWRLLRDLRLAEPPMTAGLVVA